MLTSYDQYTATLFDEAGVWSLLVGDSAANNVYGYETDAAGHRRRVVAPGSRRGPVHPARVRRRRPPLRLLRGRPVQALQTAIRFMKEGGCHAVKFEGGVRVAEQIRKVTGAGIPVMGHIGFTPQSEHQLGGYRVQGRGDERGPAAGGRPRRGRGRRLRVVLEMVPGDLARAGHRRSCPSPRSVSAPGPSCDAQVLVWQDMLGLRQGKMHPLRQAVRRPGLGHLRCRRGPTWPSVPRRHLPHAPTHTFADPIRADSPERRLIVIVAHPPDSPPTARSCVPWLQPGRLRANDGRAARGPPRH